MADALATRHDGLMTVALRFHETARFACRFDTGTRDVQAARVGAALPECHDGYRPRAAGILSCCIGP